MKMLALAFAMFVSNFAHAAGAEQFTTLQTLKTQNFYRLTCSDTKGFPQIHVYAEVEKGQVKSFKIFTIAPALSASVQDFTGNKDITAKFTGSNLQIAGEFRGDYFVTQLELNVAPGKNGFNGKFFFDDGDGTTIDRDVKCGAVNYILNANN